MLYSRPCPTYTVAGVECSWLWAYLALHGQTDIGWLHVTVNESSVHEPVMDEWYWAYDGWQWYWVFDGRQCKVVEVPWASHLKQVLVAVFGILQMKIVPVRQKGHQQYRPQSWSESSCILSLVHVEHLAVSLQPPHPLGRVWTLGAVAERTATETFHTRGCTYNHLLLWLFAPLFHLLSHVAVHLSARLGRVGHRFFPELLLPLTILFLTRWTRTILFSWGLGTSTIPGEWRLVALHTDPQPVILVAHSLVGQVSIRVGVPSAIKPWLFLLWLLCLLQFMFPLLPLLWTQQIIT